MAKVDAFERVVVRTETDPPEQRAKRWRRWSYWLLAGGLAFGALGIGLMELTRDGDYVTAGFVVATACGLAGVVAALRALWLTVTAPAIQGKAFVLSSVALLSNLAMFAIGALGTLFSTADFGRGRQLRKRGRILLAPMGANAHWLAQPMRVDAPAQLAAQWRQNGRTEHASVAAFSKLSLKLMKLGAPSALIKSAHEDALDEIRHTELCFDLARAIDGETISPDAFAEAAQPVRNLPRTLALSMLAVNSLIDGALHEGVSARVVAQLARRCQEPTTRAVLQQIARDEGRHAAHGWDVVEFCLREGGAPVAAALRGAADKIPQRLRSDLDPTSRDGSWERWGIPGEALEQAEYAKTRAHLVQRVAQLAA